MEKLNLNDIQKTQYAVPIWLRDEQIKLAVQRVKRRIQPIEQPRADPIAVVGFGPSLRETWEKIRDFKFVMTCSGSHRFLIERGIVPTWQVEVDPREHKIGLLGPPHKDVEYLVASTCHPKYFDHLDGFNVTLWHVFDPTTDGLRMLPNGDWAVTGGCDVGLRAITLASFFGFRDLHIFGLDGSAKDGDRHAAFHPNSGKKFYEVEHNGVTYITTPAMMEAAKQTIHELKQLPKVRATFYGDGLTQALVKEFQKDWKPEEKELKKPYANIIGYSKPELISSGYRDLNTQLHRDNLAYGVGGAKHAPTVLKLAKAIKAESILDYGCGKALLAKALPMPIWNYDPAFPEYSESPRSADLVTCTDVLEHIEPEKLDFVLDDLRRVIKRIGYFVIHTGPSSKTLADGRNTHLIQRDKAWWTLKLKQFFTLAQASITESGPLLYCVVAPKYQQERKAA